MLNQIQVVPGSVLPILQGQPIQNGGPAGDAWISELHAKYYSLANAGLLYSAHNTAAQAVSVALATAYTGLCISNPIGNTKKVVLLAAAPALTVAPAAIASLHVIAGYSATTQVTHTTPLAAPGIRNSLIGVGPPSTCFADTSATIPTPSYLAPLSGGFTAAALPSPANPWTDFGGAFIIPPGGFFALGALTAVTGFFSFLWAELPV